MGSLGFSECRKGGVGRRVRDVSRRVGVEGVGLGCGGWGGEGILEKLCFVFWGCRGRCGS